MTGRTELSVQPSGKRLTGALKPGQWFRAIPTPGVGNFPAIAGIADCTNLIALSPPTLLERYEIVGLSVGWGAYVVSAAANPEIQVELALLVNERVRQILLTGPQPTDVLAVDTYMLNGVWMADLINPIRVEARDRLGLRIGVSPSVATTVAEGCVGAQFSATTGADAYESVIVYDVIDLPAHRRL